ncbi:hypothetical protein AWJ20_3036 [Sugiyamaella lignohabitans]|uniref:Uncharacterized protein n=1 Tax=Sugiyamaella lignohabitans TaxID=796027 RepID=A0A167FKA8_9ASCO|nr:uncharacterized protein AWJ20_3036 [Sugiyamaella lignohabitans]ANB15409.1 hypothetical protein AWJ20_3036 [Sugiyamaella lignohabitans]
MSLHQVQAPYDFKGIKNDFKHCQVSLPSPDFEPTSRSPVPVAFYLGKSNHCIASSASLSSSEDNESCSSDYYSTVDADTHFGDWFDSASILRPCLSQLINSARESPSSNLDQPVKQIPELEESFTSTLVDYMCDSKGIVAASTSQSGSGIASSASVPRSGKTIPPSPPMSPLLFAHPMSKFIENIDFDLEDNTRATIRVGNSYTTLNNINNANCNANSIWSPQPFYRLTAKAPLDNTTIPINLDPVSPLLLAAAVTDSSESLVGLERRAVEELNLELHPYICDKFHQRPLLADPEMPFIPSDPVFPNVDELFEEYYQHLIPGTVEYVYHKQRLLRNRFKLKQLSQSMNQHEDERRRLISLARLNGLENHSRSRVKLY